MMSPGNLQNLGRDGIDAALRSTNALWNGLHSAATEMADYATRSFEHGSQAGERLMGARSFETAMQVQGEFLRASYEGLVTQTSKLGELAANTARDAIAPVESLVAKPLSTA